MVHHQKHPFWSCGAQRQLVSRTLLDVNWQGGRNQSHHLVSLSVRWRLYAGTALRRPGHSRGALVYPQFWPEDLDCRDKQVVVIGSGATAVTLVPEMAKTAAHVTMLQRSPSYVVSRPAEDKIALGLNKILPGALAYALTRWKNVLMGMYFYRVSRRRPAAVKRYLVNLAAKELGPQYDVVKHFTPRYNPWDQRVCAVPDGDLFAQIRQGKASVVTDTIDRLTPHGIRLSSGQELPADIIVAATGLQLNVLGDIAVTVDGKAFTPGDAVTYKGMMLSNLPNLVMAFGYTNASWTLKADLTAGYVCRLLKHMDTHGYKRAVPNWTTPLPHNHSWALRQAMCSVPRLCCPSRATANPGRCTRTTWPI